MNEQQRNEQVVQELAGEERGIPSVNTTARTATMRGASILAGVLVVSCAAGIAYWKYQSKARQDMETAAPKSLQLSSTVPTRTFEANPVVTPTPVAAPPLPEAVPALPPALPGSVAMTPSMEAPRPTIDKAGSSLMAVATNNTGTVNTGNSNSRNTATDSGGMAELLKPSKVGTRSATLLGNRNFLLTKGSFIDCALQTRLDSTVPGMTACVITRNIYSDNGKVLLIERGSTASGEYKSSLRQGMARIFVLWSRIKTPHGVVIDLDSPGTDQLGGAGVPGYVDTHFWERFGGALMLSLVDDVAAGLATNQNNNQFNFNNTSDAAQNMATEALKNTINIPPTLYKNQGEQVGIYIARDLDFSDVYDVSAN